MMSPCVPLLSALFQLFNAHRYPDPDTESDSFLNFGTGHLDVVLGHYAACGVVKAKETKLEWPSVQKWLSSYRGKEKEVSVQVDNICLGAAAHKEGG